MNSSSFTEGTISKLFITLTFPMMAGLVANLLIQAVDMWFISLLGHDELIAMGFIFPVSMVFVYLAIGLSAGAASVIARSVATDNKSSVSQLITDIQLIALVVATSVTIIGWLTVEPLFLLLGADIHLIPLIKAYVDIFYFNGIFTMLGMVGLSSIRALGNTKAQGYSMVFAAIINAILDPIFIFGYLGFPAMGIQGAAIASTIAKLLPLVVAYYVLAKKLDYLKVSTFRWSHCWQSTKSVLYIGLPAMANNFIIPVSLAVITALMASYGSSAVAGLGIAARIEPLILLIFNALSSVVGPYMGQNISARHFKRVDSGIKMVSLFCFLSGILMALMAYWGADSVVSWFSSDPESIRVACLYLSIVPMSYGCSGIIMMVNSSFNGIGQPIPAAIISSLRALIMYLPAAFIGSYFFQVKGIFIAYCLVNVICAIIAYAWFKREIHQLERLSRN